MQAHTWRKNPQFYSEAQTDKNNMQFGADLIYLAKK